MSQAQPTNQAFISYAHVSPDMELAAKLGSFVESHGFRVFVDTKIRVGERWVDQIDIQLHRSSYFIVLLSAASVKSDMVRREVAIAYQLNKNGALTILPVRIGLGDTLPYEMAAYLDLIQYCSWNPGEPFDSVCTAIIGAMLGQTRTIGFAIPHTPSPSRFTELEIERVASELARYIGPVAGVIVHRAAKHAHNWEQLYEILAAEIPNAEERRRFQASRLRS